MGDFEAGAVIDRKFTTISTTGAPTQLAGSPAVACYKDNSTTQSTAGLTLTVDFDTVTGLNNINVDTSADGTFYSTGSTFTLVLTAGTVSGTSVNGYVVDGFTLGRTAALKPTTAGRKLDVSAGGEAGIDWANVGSPTTVVGLSGTTVKTATDVETDTADIQTRLPAALVSGRIDASVGAMAAGTVTAAAIATGAIDADAVAADAATEIRSLASGTADSGTTTTMVDAARTEADTDYWLGQIIVFTSGTLAGQARLITAFDAVTDTITFSPATTQAVSTHTYEIWPNSNMILAQLTHTSAVVPSVTTVTGNVNGSVGSVTGAVGSVTGNVGGNVTGSVGSVATGGIAAASFAAGAIDAAAIAANAIGASELASDVITDIWQGTALTEAYAADGAAPTPAQLLYMIWSFLVERAFVNTTMTSYKLDGTTVAMTFTIDNATTPTTMTRAT